MNKTKFFAFIFFITTAVLVFSADFCSNDETRTDPVKAILCDVPGVVIDDSGNATINFTVTTADWVRYLGFDVSATGGSATIVSTSQYGAVVAFHTNDPVNFEGGSVTLYVTRAFDSNGTGRVMTGMCPSGTVVILPIEVNPDDPDDPDEPENELDQLLKKAEALEDNTFLVDDNLYTVNPEIDGGYICYHDYYISEDDDEDTLVGHTIHCLNGKLNCGVNIELYVDRIGEAFEIPIVDYIVTKKSDFEEILQFVALKNPSLPYNYDSNPRIYYSSKGHVADHCVIAEMAVVKVVENEDESMTAIAYLLAADGNECYAKFTAFNPSYEK